MKTNSQSSTALFEFLRKYTMVIALLDENDEPIESRTVQFSIAELGEKLELNVAEYWLKAKK